MPATSQSLSVLLVGAGSIGRRHARVLTALGLKDLRVCDPNEDQVAALRAESPRVRPVESFESGLAQAPDAVFVLTPPKLHIPLATAAVEAGCHVFTEKPLSMSLDGIDELDELARRRCRKVMVGMCLRFHEGQLRVKSLLDEGRIGRLVAIRTYCGEYFPAARPDYLEAYYSKYSGALDLVHDIDLAIWYADRPIRTVKAVHGSYTDLGMQAPDVAEIIIDFEDRCLASIHVDFFQHPRRRGTELLGVDGSIHIRHISWGAYTIDIYNRHTDVIETIAGTSDRDDMFKAEDQTFLHAAANDLPIACGLAEGKKSVHVVAEALAQQDNA